MLTEKQLMGKRSRRRGAAFELKVRKYLEEEEDWIVDKWTNNIDLQDDSIIKAKGNIFHSSTGFPDFFMFRKIIGTTEYEIQFTECKTNNILDKIEKQKIQVLKDKGFKCWVAYDVDGEIKFRDPKEYKDKS